MAISIGAAAIDRTSLSMDYGYTHISKDVPSNAKGHIESFEVWFGASSEADPTGIRGGTFYVVSGNTFKCRDSALLGTCVRGSKQTFTGKWVDVGVGDRIGWVYGPLGAAIEYSDSGYGNLYSVYGEYIDPGDQASYAEFSGSASSFHGIGTEGDFFFTTTVLGTDCNQKQETNPAGVLDVITSVKNGKGAAGGYWLFVPGLSNSVTTNTTFRTTRSTAAAGYRSQNLYSGTFASGNWTIQYKLQNRAAYAHAGRLVVNVYRTTYANPTPAQLTLMNSAEGQSAIISFSATSGEEKTGSFTVAVNQNLTLAGEYLFIIVNWKVTTAGGNANAGVKWGVQDGAEYEVTTEWTLAPTSQWRRLAFTSEPPTPNAWNQLKREA